MNKSFIILLICLSAVFASHQVTTFEQRRTMNVAALFNKFKGKAIAALKAKAAMFMACMKKKAGAVMPTSIGGILKMVTGRRILGFSFKKLVNKVKQGACKAGGLEAKGKAMCIQFANKAIDAVKGKATEAIKKVKLAAAILLKAVPAVDSCMKEVAASVCGDLAKAACKRL